MERNIELFMISGFLGSGKTTFLQNLLTQMGGYRVGVIVNEFGSVGIDGTVLRNDEMKMVEINNGSIFCACLKGGFVKTLVAFLEQPVDYLFVEASGLADPSNMENFLEQMTPYLDRKPQVTRRYRYRGFICIVDAIHFLQFSTVFVPTENQIRKSQFVVLNKVDDAGEKKVARTRKRILELNPEAFVYATNYGKVPMELLEDKLEACDMGMESSNTPWNRPETCNITVTQKVPMAKMREFCQLVSTFTLRIKGFFPAGNGYGMVDCVGEEIQIRTFSEAEGRKPDCRIVFIGKSRFRIQEELESAWRSVIGGMPRIEED